MENCLESKSVMTLRQRLDTRGPLPLAEVSRIVDRIAEQIDALHLSGGIHGALTPTNVLLLPENQVQLRFPKSSSPVSVTARCSGRTFVGDSTYLSPEEARGEPTTAATDIWYLGALLYEMLTGFPPYLALRFCMLRDMVTNNEPDLLPQSTAAAQFVVDRALAKWPANRFLSAQELANTFWTVAPSQHLSGGTPTATPPASSVPPGVSLQQAVNRPFSLTPASGPSNAAITSVTGILGWMRFFGGRKHSSSSTAA